MSITARILILSSDDALRDEAKPAFDALGNDYQDALNVVYLNQLFGNKSKQVSANLLSDALYYRKHAFVLDFKLYTDFRRRVQKIVVRLEANGFLVRKDGKKPDFKLNERFSETQLGKQSIKKST